MEIFKIYEQGSGVLYQSAIPENWESVWRMFSAVISLTYPGPVRAQGIHIHYYIDDGPLPEDDPEGEKLHIIAETSAGLIAMGLPVLVHCGAGINRAGLMSALIYRRLVGCSGSEAADHIRSRRPMALSNPYFNTLLNRLR